MKAGLKPTLLANREYSGIQIRTFDELRQDFVARDDQNGSKVVAAHKHGDHSHFILLLEGVKKHVIESEPGRAVAPALLIVPAGVLHAFEFEGPARGQVMNLTSTYVRDLCMSHPEFSTLFEEFRSIPLPKDPQALTAIEEVFSALHTQTRSLAAHPAAIRAHLTLACVSVLRILGDNEESGWKPSRDVDLVNDFRALIEKRFAKRSSISAYCLALGRTERQLRSACVAVTGHPPRRLILDRRLLEAKRYLSQSSLAVAQVGLQVGFEDAAYFSRLFAQHVGVAPTDFRRDSQRRQDDGRGELSRLV